MSRIAGCGYYLPQNIVTNIDLEKSIETSDEWIFSRTGIKSRHIAATDEYTSHLAFKAALDAIKNSAIDKSEIDLIIVCTTTPDNSFPSVATKLQGYLELGNIPSFDLQAVCSGFIYGLDFANILIDSGKYNNILLICAEKMSSLLDWQDRSTCVLFGDGAGAVVLKASEEKSYILDSKIYSDGKYVDILHTSGGVSSNNISGKVKMSGGILFKHAVEKMSDSITEILEKNHVKPSDIDYFIPHQANMRIIDFIVERLNFDKNKVVQTIKTHANCSAASIPLALASLNLTGKLRKGDLILFTAFGAGLTWGSVLIRW